MTDRQMTCRVCGGTEHYSEVVNARGGNGPDLLPIGGIFSSPKFRIVVCGGCGHIEWFVMEKHLEKVRTRFYPYPPEE